jgi:hypothetical protein
MKKIIRLKMTDNQFKAIAKWLKGNGISRKGQEEFALISQPYTYRKEIDVILLSPDEFELLSVLFRHIKLGFMEVAKTK